MFTSRSDPENMEKCEKTNGSKMCQVALNTKVS